MSGKIACLGLVIVSAGSCGAPPEQQALLDVKAFVQHNLDALAANSRALCEAAPTPVARGWDSALDKDAIVAMRAAWKRARPDYERIEGAIAVLFPELDRSTDERYDGFLETESDVELFDDRGVTGNHAIERILFSDAIAQRVIDFEQGLGAKYQPARFPQNQEEAASFKNSLCARWAQETRSMADDFRPLALDPASAYRGVVGSMQEQVEKVQKAATGEEESRYAQFTLADLRANLEGARKTYEAFRPWALSKGASREDEVILTAFGALAALYGGFAGDAIPAVPATWSNVNPSSKDMTTDFGRLFSAVQHAADVDTEGTLAAEMSKAADKMGIPQL
jgi:iron uptake system component EfeO